MPRWPRDPNRLIPAVLNLLTALIEWLDHHGQWPAGECRIRHSRAARPPRWPSPRLWWTAQKVPASSAASAPWGDSSA